MNNIGWWDWFWSKKSKNFAMIGFAILLILDIFLSLYLSTILVLIVSYTYFSSIEQKNPKNQFWIFILTILLVTIVFFSISFITSYNKIQEIYTLGFNCTYTVGSEYNDLCKEFKLIEARNYLSNYSTILECKNAPKKVLCVYLLARNSNNVTLCSEAEKLGVFHENVYDYCYYRFAKLKRDFNLCSKLSEQCRFDCEYDVEKLIESDKKNINYINMGNSCESLSNGEVSIYSVSWE